MQLLSGNILPPMQDNTNSGILDRSTRLLGECTMERMDKTKVIIFGIGGVGSWCAESLVRTGIKHVTLVDSDVVCITNCNRQLMATQCTIGQPKVKALKERLLDIRPDADITDIQSVYNEDTAESFHIEDYDFVIDAIDSLKDKVALILHVTSLSKAASKEGRRGPTLFSSMGAALRVDPAKIRVDEFWKVHNDTLAAAVRKKMKSNKTFPAKKFKCVYSEENPMQNKGSVSANEVSPEGFSKAQINGSLAHITGIFGFTLAGLVIEEINKRLSLTP